MPTGRKVTSRYQRSLSPLPHADRQSSRRTGLSEQCRLRFAQGQNHHSALALAVVTAGHRDDCRVGQHLIGRLARLARGCIHVDAVTGVDESDDVGIWESQRGCDQVGTVLLDQASAEYSRIGHDLTGSDRTSDALTAEIVDRRDGSGWHEVRRPIRQLEVVRAESLPWLKIVRGHNDRAGIGGRRCKLVDDGQDAPCRGSGGKQSSMP